MKNGCLDALSTSSVIFDPGSTGYLCHLCSVVFKKRAGIPLYSNGKDHSARAALVHQSALKNQHNNISIYAHDITLIFLYMQL